MTLFQTAGKADVSPYVRALVASHQGVCSTKFALTAPNPLFAATAACLPPLAEAGARFVKVETEEELFALKLLLAGSAEERNKRLGFPVDTLVFDCLDEFQRRILIERVLKQKRTETTFEDWNWISQKLNAILEGFSELDLNIIVLTHLTNIEETDSVKPNIQGAFCSQIHNHVDYAFYLGVQDDPTVLLEGEDVSLDNLSLLKSSYYLQTRPSSKVQWAHDNTGTLPDFIDLTFENDFDTILVSRKNLTLAESSSIEVTLDEPEEKQEPETPAVEEEISRDDSVVGMTSVTDIKSLLAAKKNNKTNNTVGV